MKKIAIIICLLWIGVIFYLSGEPGKVSNEKSLTVVDYIKKLYVTSGINRSSTDSANKEVFNSPQKTKVNTKAETAVDKKLNVIVRKSGHYIEYLVLSIILSSIIIKVKYKSIIGVIPVLFICLFIAVLDEYYQSFTGRTSKVSDVLIDFGGAITGVLLCVVYQNIRRVFNVK